tara:strand:- start:53647 stop:54168 length:522 start_codon:yes stop_codon:yes gene_type:complete
MKHMMIIAVVFSITMAANAKKKYLGPIESPPGGARADHQLWKQWEGMVKDQHFPQLPHSDVLKKDKTDYENDSSKRQRYIMQIDVDAVDLKNEIFDDGYYHFAYSSKGQGDFLIQVHPKYRLCFDDLKKKFDYMQAVVFTHGEIVGRKVVRIEKPRQCLGQLKDTGSKLPDAK